MNEQHPGRVWAEQFDRFCTGDEPVTAEWATKLLASLDDARICRASQRGRSQPGQRGKH